MNCGYVRTNSWILLLMSLFYMIPISIGYILVLRVVGKRKSSFFRLYSLQVIVIVAQIYSELIERFFRTGIICEFLLDVFSEPSHFYSVLFLFPTLYFPQVQAFAGLCISINRASVMFRPMTYENTWNWMLKYVLASALIIPVIPVLNIIVSPAYLELSDNTTAQLEVEYMRLLPMKTSLWNTYYNLILSILIVIVTVITWYRLSRLGLASVRTYERRTLTYGFVSSFAVLACAAANVRTNVRVSKNTHI